MRRKAALQPIFGTHALRRASVVAMCHGREEAMVQFRYIEFRRLGWRERLGLGLAAALGIAIIVALVVLAFSIAIVLLPVVAVLVLIGAWRMRKLRAEAMRRYGEGQRKTADPDAIEIDYTVIDDDRRR